MTRATAAGNSPQRSGVIRIVYIVTHPMTAKFLLRGQLAFLGRHGYEVHLIAAADRYLNEVRETESIHCVTVPMHREIRPLLDLVALVAIFRQLRRIRPHIVNASTPKAGLLGMLAAYGARVPHRIYTMRGLRLETTHGWRRAILATAERLAAATSNRVACVSKSLRARYLQLGLASANKVRVPGAGSSNGVDTTHYQPGPDATDIRLRRHLGLPDGAPVIGFVGRLTRDKGIEDLTSAFVDNVLPRFPSARLLVVGQFEPGDPVTESTRVALTRCSAVIMPGFVDDTAPYYRLMNVLAFPSFREGFPNAPLEAAASAIPVVAYRCTGTVDAVVDGVTGRLVPVGNIGEFAEALCDYLSDPGLGTRHGAKARSRAYEDFRREVVWESWERLYRDCLFDSRAEGTEDR